MSRSRILAYALWATICATAFLTFHKYGDSSFLGMEEPTSLFTWIGLQWLSASGDFAHGWIMPIFSLGLVIWKRNDIAAAEKAVFWPAFGLIVFGLLLHFTAYRAEQPRVSLVALTILIWSIPTFVFGIETGKIILFPCAYLLLCFTSYLLVSLTLRLRLLSSILAGGILNGAGIETIRRGTALFSTAGGGFSFDVADPCSGLRSLVVMTTLSAPYAWFTQKTIVKKWTLFILSVPLAIVANVIRIVSIAGVAEFSSLETAMRIYHDFSGFLVFGASVLLLVYLDKIMQTNIRGILSKWKANRLGR